MNIDTTPEGTASKTWGTRSQPVSWTRPAAASDLQAKPNVLAEIYGLTAEGKTDQALDRLFEVVDDLFVSGNFAGCESMLQNVDLGRLDVDLMIGFLSITLAGKKRLGTRADFLRRVEERLRRTVPADQAVALLRGLE